MVDARATDLHVLNEQEEVRMLTEEVTALKQELAQQQRRSHRDIRKEVSAVLILY